MENCLWGKCSVALSISSNTSANLLFKAALVPDIPLPVTLTRYLQYD
jgi:hypothetical protein